MSYGLNTSCTVELSSRVVALAPAFVLEVCRRASACNAQLVRGFPPNGNLYMSESYMSEN